MDRKQTLQQVDEFLTTKIAPNEFVDEIKQIGVALLPTTTGKSLPAPTEAKPEPRVEAAAEPPPQINSVPTTGAKADEPSGFPRPLSPYASVMSLLLLHKFLIVFILCHMLVLQVVAFASYLSRFEASNISYSITVLDFRIQLNSVWISTASNCLVGNFQSYPVSCVI
ncbi:hypothetical protein QQP08_003910 [Theobroma cacao]|nr:hypothetical protein QQP08_003910 [Theobroma cacao]